MPKATDDEEDQAPEVDPLAVAQPTQQVRRATTTQAEGLNNVPAPGAEDGDNDAEMPLNANMVLEAGDMDFAQDGHGLVSDDSALPADLPPRVFANPSTHVTDAELDLELQRNRTRGKKVLDKKLHQILVNLTESIEIYRDVDVSILFL